MLPYLVFHPGTQHSWQTSSALQQIGRLHYYATSIFYQPDLWPYRLERYLPGALGRRLHSEFSRFAYSGLDPAKVRTAGAAEWAERVANRLGFRNLARRLDGYGNRAFANLLKTEIQGPTRFGLWGYDGAASTVFAMAEGSGRHRVLDRTIGDRRVYNRILERLSEDVPEFLPRDVELAAPAWRIAADQREYEIADTIVIGSPYAAETIRRECGDPAIGAKVKVLNYCYDARLFGNAPPPRLRPRGEPLRFLFLGQANVRKGIHHVLRAVDRLPAKDAALTIVGDLAVPRSTFARYADRVTLIPTVPRAGVPRLMAEHDVYLLPSYFEGSAISLIEALASGLAVIQTEAAGCGATERSGVVLPEPDGDALLAVMERLVEDREQVLAWREGALLDARSYTFDRYRDVIAALTAAIDAGGRA